MIEDKLNKMGLALRATQPYVLEIMGEFELHD
jgi:hypothetical protein